MTKPSALEIPHSPAAPEVSEGGSFSSPLIATGAQLAELLEKIKLAERVADRYRSR